MSEQILVQSATAEDDASGSSIHYHGEHEIILVTRGAARVEIAGRQYVDQEGSLVVIGNLEMHRTSALSHLYDRTYALLPSETIRSFRAADLFSAFFVNRPHGFRHCLPTGSFGPHAVRLFEAMEREAREGRPFSNEAVLCLVEQLLIGVWRENEALFPMEDSPAKALVRKASAILEQEYAMQTTIAGLSERLFVSASYLTHCFKRITGYTPKHYQLLCRLAAARRLLATTRQPVAEVASAVGFADANQFIRAFKKHTGIPPGRFRQRI